MQKNEIDNMAATISLTALNSWPHVCYSVEQLCLSMLTVLKLEEQVLSRSLQCKVIEHSSQTWLQGPIPVRSPTFISLFVPQRVSALSEQPQEKISCLVGPAGGDHDHVVTRVKADLAPHTPHRLVRPGGGHRLPGGEKFLIQGTGVAVHLRGWRKGRGGVMMCEEQVELGRDKFIIKKKDRKTTNKMNDYQAELWDRCTS